MSPRRSLPAALVAVGAAAALVGCNSGASPMQGMQGTTQVGFVSITPAAQTSGVRPDARVRVHVTQGQVRSVTVSDGNGGTLSGALSTDHRTWLSRTPLTTGTVYDVTAAAADAKGHAVTVTTMFWTLKSSKHLAARIAPLSGETVGIGMPIAVYFTAPVKNRAAVEARFHVTSTQQVAGAWHWYSDSEMHYRPPQFWPANDHISLRYDLRGADAGGGVWGDQHRTIAFSIGASHVSKVYAQTHTMKVYDGGRLVQTYPVSTGRDKYPTTSGIHVVLNKNPDQLMDSSTVGIPRNGPGGYYEHVPWSVRISNSGEFVHDAPWSVHQQGHVNVSHGCVNLSPTASKWFFDYTRRGDIVEVIGTPRPLQQGNGYADWNLSWSDWKAGDALH